MSKTNKTAKKGMPALLKALLFVLFAVGANGCILKIYQCKIDWFNAWSGLDLPAYDGEQVKTISIAVFAIFSLMAVIWRSIISAEQVSELQAQGRRTEKQIENTEIQIQQTEVKNLTELFTKGVELINTQEREKNAALVLAGVSILHQVALKQDGLFRKQVEDILIKNFLEGATLDQDSPIYKWTALDVLNKIQVFYDEEIFLPRTTIMYVCFDEIRNFYNNINGMTYKNCYFFNISFSTNGNRFIECSFNDLDIVDTIIIVNQGMFFGCLVKGFNFLDNEENLETKILIFTAVDFSGCLDWYIFDKGVVHFNGCTYDPENPPVEELRKLIDAANEMTVEERVGEMVAAACKARAERETKVSTDDK